jgi:pimeloyl-ACP methyl ester carboxylesterase
MLLVHGFGAAIGYWRCNIEALSAGHTVYALDLLGFGASEKVVARYGIELWAEQVYDFWQTFIRKPVILVGNSLGSSVCLLLAALYPDMVAGLVMLNLPDGSVLDTPAWVRSLGVASRPVLTPVLTLARGVFTSPPIFIPFFRFLRQRWLLKGWAGLAYADRQFADEEFLDIVATPPRDRGAIRALRAMVNAKPPTPNRTARVLLPMLKMPALLIWGLQDKFVPPLGEAIQRFNPAIKLIELEQVGHLPHDEQPDQVNQAILNWVASSGL